jgi:hypothetical protein
VPSHAPPIVAGVTSSASHIVSRAINPEPACTISAAVKIVQLKVWKMPRRSSLPQPRTLAHRVGTAPDRPARPPSTPPINPTAVSATFPPMLRATGARWK